MASVKSRAARTGAKYVVTHPRSRVTRFAVRFVLRRLGKRVGKTTAVAAIPEVRGSRVPTVVGVVAVAGGIVLLARRTRSDAPAPAAAASTPPAPFPAAAPAAAPPETRDAPSTRPTTSPAAEAAAATAVAADGDDDATLIARVQGKLSETAAVSVVVEAASGVITLRGDVADEEAERRLVSDAEQVRGVKAVQSELRTAADEGPLAS